MLDVEDYDPKAVTGASKRVPQAAYIGCRERSPFGQDAPVVGGGEGARCNEEQWGQQPEAEAAK